MQVVTTNYRKNIGWNIPLPAIDSPQTLVLVFGAPSFANYHQPFIELKNKYPNSVIAGCSTAGEIFDDLILDYSLVVSIIKFEHTAIRFYATPISKAEDSYNVGKTIVTHLIEKDLSSVLIFTDGLLINGSHFIKGVNEKLNQNIVVTGGLAGDGTNFQHTWVLMDGLPQSGYVSGIGFYGDAICINYGSQGGWRPFGPIRPVTKSVNNILYELDHKPALALYKEYLGDMANDLPATGLRFPLALSNGNSDKYLVRTILAVDEKEQSLTFAGNIPTGHYAQLMYATFDSLIDGAEQAASMTQVGVKSNQEVLAIAISCVGRRMVLEEEPGAELEATLEFLPEQTKQIGFYSYGEFSPFVKNGHCDLHNQTMTLTIIYENV